jgi:hypothetical protein
MIDENESPRRLSGTTMTKRPVRLPTLPVEELINRFTEASIARKTALDKHKPALANKEFDRMINAYVELKRRGREAQDLLLPLLSHDDREVRLHAGIMALEFAPHLAEPVLQAVHSLHGMTGYEADLALREWRKGALKFPPYEK